jgi:hypothetical protein
MKIGNFKKCVFVTFLILPLVLITSCKRSFEQEWNNATIDTNISRNPIYAQLDNQKETLFSALENQDTLPPKKTSDVEYSTGKQMNVGEFNNLKIYNCRAYYYHWDTLSINIGIGTGFGGQGFIIKYKDQKFYTEPYFSTDLIIIGEPEPTYKIVYQKLTLDKAGYLFGDSLYGYIDFKSIERDENKKTTEHWGKGYFRTKIMKL